MWCKFSEESSQLKAEAWRPPLRGQADVSLSEQEDIGSWVEGRGLRLAEEGAAMKVPQGLAKREDLGRLLRGIGSWEVSGFGRGRGLQVACH